MQNELLYYTYRCQFIRFFLLSLPFVFSFEDGTVLWLLVNRILSNSVPDLVSAGTTTMMSEINCGDCIKAKMTTTARGGSRILRNRGPVTEIGIVAQF